EIVRSWYFPDVAKSLLFVATPGELWRYDLDGHEWNRIDVTVDGSTFGPGGAAFDLRPDAGAVLVLAMASSGTRYGGSLDVKPGPPPPLVLKRLEPAAAPAARPSASPVFHIGAVTFFREVRHGLLAVLRTEDGRSLTAYRDRRFLWDTGRRGISIAAEGVLLESDAGIHPARGLASFDPGPPGPAAPADRMEMGS